VTTPVAGAELTAELRRGLDALVGDLPGRSGDLAFDEPWELRAFALVVAAYEAGGYPWGEFQQALIASIRQWEESSAATRAPWSYYEHWVRAFEAVLGERGTVDRDAVEVRTCDVLATPRNRNHHEPHYEPIAVDPANR
jgi:nitrile hydratase